MAEKDKVDEIFKLFLRANKIEGKTEFGQGRRTYSGLEYSGATKKEIMRSETFAAFVDGAMQNKPKYGSFKARKKHEEERAREFLENMAASGVRIIAGEKGTLGEAVNKAMKGDAAAGIEKTTATLIAESPEIKYQKQYLLGVTVRGRL